MVSNQVRTWTKKRPIVLFRILIEDRAPRRAQLRQLMKNTFAFKDEEEVHDAISWIEERRRMLLRDYADICEDQQRTITEFTERSEHVLRDIESSLRK